MKQFFLILLVFLLFTSCSLPDHNIEYESNLSEESIVQSEIIPSNSHGFIFSEKYGFINLENEITAIDFLSNEDYIIAFCYDGFLRIYSTDNGKLIFSEDYSSYGKIMRMEKYVLKDGYDYRLCFGDRIIYRNSNDISIYQEQILPNGVSYKINYSFTENSYYDLNEMFFIYTIDNGICIYDGFSEKTIIENKMFSTVNDFWDKTLVEKNYDISSPIYFGDPRFICNGTKIVVGVFSEWDSSYVGCAIYDLNQNAFERYIYCPMPQKPVYPIDDRYINIPSEYFVDAQTGSMKKIKHGNSKYMSHDYKTFVTYNFEIDEETGLYKYFDASILDIDTEEEKSFFCLDDNYLLSVEGITDTYFIVNIYYPNESYTYAMVYKD